MKVMRRLLLGTVAVFVLALAFFLYNPVRTVLSFQQMDNLYTMTYSGRYSHLSRFVPQFEQSSETEETSQSSTLFAAVGDRSHPVLGQDRQVSRTSMPLVLYTDPPNGYASVSVVDMSELGLGLDCDMNPLVRQFMLLLTPLMVSEGMNEHGVAIANTELPGFENIQQSREEKNAFRAMLRGVLDHARSTQEAVDLLKEYSAFFRPDGGYFLIADASGKSVVVQFQDGDVQVLYNDEQWPMAAEARLARLNEEGWGDVNHVPSLPNNKTASNMDNPEPERERGQIWSTLFNMHTGDVVFSTTGEFDDELYRINLRPRSQEGS